MSVATVDWAVPFEALEEGLAFATEEHIVTQGEVLAFAELTGDHHPQHTDAEWAASSAFGGRIAHGLLVVSLAAGLVPFDPDRVVALRAVDGVRFKRPVRPGESLRVEGRVDGLRAVGEDAGLVTFAWRIVNGAGELCCRARVDVLWRAGA